MAKLKVELRAMHATKVVRGFTTKKPFRQREVLVENDAGAMERVGYVQPGADAKVHFIARFPDDFCAMVCEAVAEAKSAEANAAAPEATEPVRYAPPDFVRPPKTITPSDDE